MKAHLINTHLVVSRSRSSAKVKVKYQGHVSQKMGVSGAFFFFFFWLGGAVSLGKTLQNSSLVLVKIRKDINNASCHHDMNEILLKAVLNTIRSISAFQDFKSFDYSERSETQKESTLNDFFRSLNKFDGAHSWLT